MGNHRTYIADSIVRVCHKLDQKGFVANHDGNITVKFDGTLLATPTAVSKASLVPDMIITLDMEGKKIDGIGKPFSEIQLHLAAYRARDDISAVVHAHPPHATARGLLGKEIRPALPEAIVSIGDIIPVAPFAMPGAPENDAIVSDALGRADVFMMPGNGVLSVGSDIEQAYLRLELAEHLARIYYLAEAAGKPFELSAVDAGALLEKRTSIGLGPKGGKSGATKTKDPLREMIMGEVRKLLNG